TVIMAVMLLSLTGMPPLVGFVGKFMIFAVLYQTGWMSLLIVGVLNTVFSLVYYVNVMRIMCIRGEPDQKAPCLESTPVRLYCTAIAIPVLLLGILPSGLITMSER